MIPNHERGIILTPKSLFLEGGVSSFVLMCGLIILKMRYRLLTHTFEPELFSQHGDWRSVPSGGACGAECQCATSYLHAVHPLCIVNHKTI